MKREELKSIFDALRNDPSHHLGLGDIRLTIAQQDEILAMVSPLPPAEGAAVAYYPLSFITDAIASEHQPTAEGAEEILKKTKLRAASVPSVPLSWLIAPESPTWNAVVAAMHEFATLHAQKIADKMVSERLKNAPKNCPKAAQCAHVEGGMKCPPNVICPI